MHSATNRFEPLSKLHQDTFIRNWCDVGGEGRVPRMWSECSFSLSLSLSLSLNALKCHSHVHPLYTFSYSDSYSVLSLRVSCGSSAQYDTFF